MQLISQFNQRSRFLLCVINIHSKYAWVIPLKDKKGVTITNAFQKILKDNEGKSLIAERFIRTLKNKIHKYITSISTNVYIDKLDIVNKYNNTYHSIIKMKPVDVKPSTYIGSSNEINYQDPKFKIGDFLQKSMFQIGLKKFL